MLTTSDIFFLPILAFVIRRPRCVGGSMPRLNGMAVKQASEYVLIYITHENAICYKKIEKFFNKVAITLCGSGNPGRKGVLFFRKMQGGFPRFCARLAEFCFTRFSCGLAKRRNLHALSANLRKPCRIFYKHCRNF